MTEPEKSTERYWEARWRDEHAENGRLTKERDLALANADAVYARLMPEIERLRAALTQIGSVANHGVNNPREPLARVYDLVRINQQSPNTEK